MKKGKSLEELASANEDEAPARKRVAKVSKKAARKDEDEDDEAPDSEDAPTSPFSAEALEAFRDALPDGVTISISGRK